MIVVDYGVRLFKFEFMNGSKVTVLFTGKNTTVMIKFKLKQFTLFAKDGGRYDRTWHP